MRNDFDAILVYHESAEAILLEDETAQQLLSYTGCREAGFDLFAFSAVAARRFPHLVHLDAFDYDTETGRTKGVVEVTL